MVSALDKKKAEVQKAIENIEIDDKKAFEKSTRTTETYHAISANNEKIVVTFQGNNFKIGSRSNGRTFPIKSLLIRDMSVEKMVKFVTWRLTVKAKEDGE